MVDLYSHILPGIDNESIDWDKAVEMCRAAAADGVDRIVASPSFFHPQLPTPPERTVRSALVGLRARISAFPGDFEILLGPKCYMHDGIVESLRKQTLLTINEGRYFLLELPEDIQPHDLDELVFELCLIGKIPIIAHPERHRLLSSRPEVLYELIRTGAYAQVTAASLTGQLGLATRRVAQEMVKCRLVQIIASGARDLEERPPVLSKAAEKVDKILGSDLGQRMVEDVPRSVIEDRPIEFEAPVRPSRRALRWWNWGRSTRLRLSRAARFLPVQQ